MLHLFFKQFLVIVLKQCVRNLGTRKTAPLSVQVGQRDTVQLNFSRVKTSTTQI